MDATPDQFVDRPGASGGGRGTHALCADRGGSGLASVAPSRNSGAAAPRPSKEGRACHQAGRSSLTRNATLATPSCGKRLRECLDEQIQRRRMPLLGQAASQSEDALCLVQFHVTRSAELERLCDAAGRLGCPQLPLFRAAADGLLALIIVNNPAAAWPAAVIQRNVNRPTCVLVGGDPGHGEPDPAPIEWMCAKRLKSWCRAAVVHGAGGEAARYRNAAFGAVLTGRLALVETTSARADEWVAFLRCQSTLLIRPTNGLHPVPPQRGSKCSQQPIRQAA